MQETKNITSGLEVKLNKSYRLYHAIQGFMNMKQGETDLNDAFKLRLKKSAKPWNSQAGTKSSAAKNSPIMGFRH